MKRRSHTRSFARTDEPPVTGPALLEFKLPVNLDAELNAFRHLYILHALRATNGNVRQAAELVGLSYKTFSNWMERYAERVWNIAVEEGIVEGEPET